MNQEHHFTFKLEGDEHEFDAENLSTVLSSLTNLVKYVQDINFPGSTSSIKITANREGSFTLEAAVLLSLSPNIISSVNQIASSVENAKQCLDLVIALFKLKEHVQETPLEIVKIEKGNNGMVVINKDNSKLNITNINLGRDFFENPNADVWMTKLCSAIENENKKGFSIEDDSQKFKLDHDECKKMGHEIIGPNLNELENVETRFATIHIRKPDLIGNTKWDIIYMGKNIKAKMLDLNFINEIHKGEVKLSNETKLSVEMKVKIFLDKKKKIPTLEEYEIINVLPIDT